MDKKMMLALALALGISGTALAANPFSDLPAGHWAYGANWRRPGWWTGSLTVLSKGIRP